MTIIKTNLRILATTILTGAISLVWIGSAEAGFSSDSVYLPSVARASGAAGSTWFTTVWINNPEVTTATIGISALQRDTTNPNPPTQSVTLAGGQTMKFDDVLVDLFGLDSFVGALRFSADQPILVSARIFNMQGTDLAGSQGQFFAGMPTRLAIGSQQPMEIPAVLSEHEGAFRCNFGAVEVTGLGAVLQVDLLDAAGDLINSATYSLGGYQPMQVSIEEIDAPDPVDPGKLRFTVISGEGRILPFASMVGNGIVSQDPSTLEPAYGPILPTVYSVSGPDLFEITATSWDNPTQVITIPGIPKGNYLVMMTGLATVHGAGGTSRLVCRASLGSSSAMTIVTAGSAAGYTRQSTLALSFVVQSDQLQDAQLSCWLENSTIDGSVTISGSRLHAIEIGSVIP